MKKTILRALLTTILITLQGVACAATSCKYDKEYIPENSVQGGDIKHHTWLYSRDPDSEEHVKTLYILYENGDQAVIEQKYCSMYNFELAYFVGKTSTVDSSLISRIVGKHVKQYSAKLKGTSKQIESSVNSTLVAYKFSSAKPFSRGINANLSSNENTELSISYMPYEDIGSIYTGIIGFYLGVGGQ